ncbi:hypothetical protein SALBM135S_09093 [Streptomyces alboniger]
MSRGEGTEPDPYMPGTRLPREGEVVSVTGNETTAVPTVVSTAAAASRSHRHPDAARGPARVWFG